MSIEQLTHQAVRKYTLDPVTRTPRKEIAMGQKSYPARSRSSKTSTTPRASTAENQNALLREQNAHWRYMAETFFLLSIVFFTLIVGLCAYIVYLQDSALAHMMFEHAHATLIPGGVL